MEIHFIIQTLGNVTVLRKVTVGSNHITVRYEAFIYIERNKKKQS